MNIIPKELNAPKTEASLALTPAPTPPTPLTGAQMLHLQMWRRAKEEARLRAAISSSRFLGDSAPGVSADTSSTVQQKFGA